MKYSIRKQPSTILEEIAEKHKNLRKNHHLTQLELANRSGVSLGSLKRFETTGHINFESLLKLAHFFNRLNDFDLVFQEDYYKEIEKLFSK
ncbi:MAG: helix-turn-helix domain-containing protein [Solirubrobacteraceae bacterium]